MKTALHRQRKAVDDLWFDLIGRGGDPASLTAAEAVRDLMTLLHPPKVSLAERIHYVLRLAYQGRLDERDHWVSVTLKKHPVFRAAVAEAKRLGEKARLTGASG